MFHDMVTMIRVLHQMHQEGTPLTARYHDGSSRRHMCL